MPRSVQSTVKLGAVLMGSCAVLMAQTPEVELRLAAANGQTSFRMGEPIPLELTYTSTVPGKYSVFGGGTDRLGFEALNEEFRVSPADGAVDPLADRFKGGMAANGLGWLRMLSAEPLVVKKDLNQWLRFDRPGQYRVHAVSHRVRAAAQQVEVASNEIDIELVDDPAWRAAQLAEASRILRTVPKSGESKVFEQRMAAARQLWYLNTPESIRESARLLDGGDVQVDQLLRLGLVSASRRRLVLEIMQQLLADPAQPVSPEFLDTLAQLGPSAAQELRARLATVLEAKRGAAKAVSLKTLIQTADSPDSVSAGQRAEIAGLFFELPSDPQEQLLAWQWSRVSGPALIPVLRSVYDAVPDSVYRAPPLAVSAVERLYELDPAQGRGLILAEMERAFPRLPFSTLSLLPDATLPAMEEKWMANLELAPGKAARGELEELVARYATDAILGRVKTLYARVDAETRARQGTVGDPPRRLATPACEPPLYAYFLRTDPPYGEKRLRDAMAERSFEMGHCWMTAIGQTAGYYVNPRWESVALDGLNDSTVAVKIDAVKALGQYGSPAAVARLWDAFRYFHDWWKSKPSEINQENLQLEQAYVQTVSHAANWIATGEDLARAAAFCITDRCRGEMEQERRYWSQPLTASVSQSNDGNFNVSLAQYEMRSLAAARRRLLQLPAGSELRWKQITWQNRPVAALEAWVEQVLQELRDRGIAVAR